MFMEPAPPEYKRDINFFCELSNLRDLGINDLRLISFFRMCCGGKNRKGRLLEIINSYGSRKLDMFLYMTVIRKFKFISYTLREM